MHILFLAQRNIKRWTAKVAKVAKMPRGPYAFESGALKGRRCIWGGRANVRQALYMAEMSASNWNPELKAFHDRLAAAGKKPKVIIVAVMRKMITTLAQRNIKRWTAKVAKVPIADVSEQCRHFRLVPRGEQVQQRA